MHEALARFERHARQVAEDVDVPNLGSLMSRTVFAMFSTGAPAPAGVADEERQALVSRIAADAACVFESVFRPDEQLFVIAIHEPRIAWEIEAELQDLLARGAVDLPGTGDRIELDDDLRIALVRLAECLPEHHLRTAEVRLRPRYDEDLDEEVPVLCLGVELERHALDHRALFEKLAWQDFGFDAPALRMYVLLASAERPVFFLMPDDRWFEVFAPEASQLERVYRDFAHLLDESTRDRMTAAFGYWPRA